MTRELVKPDAALWVREQAIDRFPECEVDRSPPPGRLVDLERPLLTFYSQDVYRQDLASWVEVIAYRVFAGSREFPEEAERYAALVEAWLWTLARPVAGCPVAAVIDSNGPNMVPDEHETAVLYGTVEMVIAGVFPPA